MPTVLLLNSNPNTMKPILIKTFLLSFLSLISITILAYCPAAQNQKDSTIQVVKEKTDHNFQSIYNFWSFLPCDSATKKVSSVENTENQPSEELQKVQQPIIGGYLGMILFEPNFFDQSNQSTNNKG